jgi:hypothetical protein
LGGRETISGRSCPAGLQGAGHPLGRVPAQLGRDVGVALGLADLGVTEDLLDDADADALLQ